MGLVYEEQKKNRYIVYPNLVQTVLYEKTNNYEKRLTDVESEIKDLFEELNNHITNDNQFLPNRQNTRYDTYAHYRTEEKKSERKLESIVSELKEAEDKKLQIQIVGS